MPLESSPEQPVPVRTVSRLIGEWVHKLGSVWVEGQVTQLNHRTGSPVVFLTLRDPAADVSIAVRCGADLVGQVVPAVVAGSRVVVLARPEFYLNRGTLSLNASDLRHVGIGELLARLERLKQVLAAEGLFAADRKRPLPFLPAAVGLVCGRGSAAEQDVLENAARRWPAVTFTVKNVPVQGPHAVPEVISALRALDGTSRVEVIIIARGGGSLEDLLPFSDEALVRAVAACRTPVVSAIGHEQDSPLLDLVADVRASTPTDAAKRVVPAVAEELALVADLRERSRAAVIRWLAQQVSWVADVRARPGLAAPERAVELREQDLQANLARLRAGLARRVERAQDDLRNTRDRVRSLSPLATLRRGYTVLLDAKGDAVRTVRGVEVGHHVRAAVADGALDLTIDAVTPAPRS
ncbi:MAG: exodeoxyribonuclease VII large subunit [Sporichthyaceae bacterium]|nr:exodeoxyribonuclease VII large subunit [Sporichthyaceae bacterium]